MVINANGTRVAYQSQVTSGNTGFEIFVYDIATQTRTRVTYSGSSSSQVRFNESSSITADGNHLVFISNNTAGNPGGHFEVFLADLTDLSALANCAVGADLIIAKADAPDPVLVKKTLTYTLTVGNNGPLDATGVTVTDTLPSGVTFGSSATSQGSCTGTSTVTCNLGNLASGASATVTITVTPTTAGTLSNTASVHGNEADPDMTNNADTETTTVTTASQAITLTVMVQGQGGTVTITPPGTTCQGTCKTTYATGTQVTLTAQASGSRFTGWGGDCAGTTTTTCTLTMNQDHSVKATFKK